MKHWRLWFYQYLRETLKDLELKNPNLAKEAGYQLSIDEIDTAGDALQALDATPPAGLMSRDGPN